MLNHTIYVSWWSSLLLASALLTQVLWEGEKKKKKKKLLCKEISCWWSNKSCCLRFLTCLLLVTNGLWLISILRLEFDLVAWTLLSRIMLKERGAYADAARVSKKEIQSILYRLQRVRVYKQVLHQRTPWQAKGLKAWTGSCHLQKHTEMNRQSPDLWIHDTVSA